MADGVSVTIDTRELKKAQEKIRAYTENFLDCIRDTINEYAIKIWSQAKFNLDNDPRRIDDGVLRNTMAFDVVVDTLADFVKAVFATQPYAVFVHWGTGIHGENPEGGHRKTPWIYFDRKRQQFFMTRGMRPNPFMLDAFNKYKDDMLAAFKRCGERK